MLPREKALNYGIETLNNEELLALVIKSGGKNNSVFEISKNIINKAGGFNNLLSLNYEELIDTKGISNAKALEILAILEIAKRILTINSVKEDYIHDSNDVVNYIKCNISFSITEEFFVIFLKSNGSIIKGEVLFKGTYNSSNVGVNELLRKALLYKAVSIIIAHNHPSGNINPSNEDIILTKRIADACKLMDIRLLDHIIVTTNSHFSFKSNGLV